MKQQITIGNEVQVYNKGEAYVGCLVAFGKVGSIDEDLEGNLCYGIVDFEGNYNDVEYDIVLVSLINPFFAKHYLKNDN